MRALRGLQRGRHDVEVVRLGPISVRLHRPADGDGGPRPAVLWIHGGGFVIGNARQEDDRCRELARALGAVVASVDYRLAPEHPFPMPLHDCHDDGRRGSQARTRSTRPGSRSGAAAPAAGSRRASRSSPASAVAFDRWSSSSCTRCWTTAPPLVIASTNATSASGTAARTASVGARTWGTSPGPTASARSRRRRRADDLSGLPRRGSGSEASISSPTRTSSTRCRLRAAGVACELCVVDGAYHGFDVVHHAAPISREFHDAQVDALARGFGAVERDPRA